MAVRHRQDLDELLNIHQRLAESLTFLSGVDCTSSTPSGSSTDSLSRVSSAPAVLVCKASPDAAGGLPVDKGDPLLVVVSEGNRMSSKHQANDDSSPADDDWIQREAAEGMVAEGMDDSQEGPVSPLDYLVSLVPQNQYTEPLVAWVYYLKSLREPERTGLLHSLISSSRFEMGCLSVIIMNAVFAAYVVDYEIQHVGQEKTSSMKAVEWSFLIFYTAELLLKLTLHRLFFFWNDDLGWNIFDMVLVMLSLYDQLMSIFVKGDAANVSFMRIFRLLKLSKVARLFRVLKFFRELRLMLMAIRASVSSLFWALIMIQFIFYIVGLVILQGLSNLLLEHGEGTREPALPDETAEQVEEHFGSLFTTLISLYKASTGGNDWGMYYDLVAEAGALYGFIFLLYIAFFTFSVLNILTGIIVENVVSMAQSDQETMLLEYRRKLNGEIEDMKNLFKCLDTDGSGALSLEEWEASLETEKAQALMASMDLDVKESSQFFNHLLELSVTDSVDIDAFVDGCVKMKGGATGVDMQLLSFETKLIHKTLNDILGSLSDPKGA